MICLTRRCVLVSKDRSSARRLTRCFWPARRPGTMIGLVIVLLFLGLDLALVVLALLWLSERRSMADITDMRYRGRWRRR